MKSGRRRLGHIQCTLAKPLKDDWSRGTQYGGHGERAYEAMEKIGIVEIDPKSKFTVSGRPEANANYWRVRRGPNWFNYGWQWTPQACRRINVAVFVAEDEKAKMQHFADLRREISALADQIVEESEKLAAGKNDHSDLLELARKRAALQAELATIDALPPNHYAVYVLFTDGVIIRRVIKHGWSVHAIEEARVEYTAKYGCAPPAVEKTHRVG